MIDDIKEFNDSILYSHACKMIDKTILKINTLVKVNRNCGLVKFKLAFVIFVQ